jgi:uncharacterized membrane protein YhaH (DUF805 family)
MEWAILPYKRYAEFNGRSRRMEYWSYVLLSLISIVAIVTPAIIMGVDPDNWSDTTIGKITAALLAIWFFANIIPSLALSIRRWHDLGQSGWFFLLFAVLGAIPVIGVVADIANLIWFFLPGTMGENKYGPDPKGFSGTNYFDEDEPPRPIERIS